MIIWLFRPTITYFYVIPFYFNEPFIYAKLTNTNIGIDRWSINKSIDAPSDFDEKPSDSKNDNDLSKWRQDIGFENIEYHVGGVSNSTFPGWRSNYQGDYTDANLKPICTQHILSWAWQISRGMAYLNSQNVLHRDLAACNILLADDNVVEICDYGLAVNMYKDKDYLQKGNPLPIKWMAIESIRDGVFSTKTDVWSFGIVLWEIFTLAHTPYPGIEDEQLYDKLTGGYRMEKPQYATQEIFDIMLQCWQVNPSSRPKFAELVPEIGKLLAEDVRKLHQDLDTYFADTHNTILLQNVESDYFTMMFGTNSNSPSRHESVIEREPESVTLYTNPLSVPSLNSNVYYHTNIFYNSNSIGHIDTVSIRSTDGCPGCFGVLCNCGDCGNCDNCCDCGDCDKCCDCDDCGDCDCDSSV